MSQVNTEVNAAATTQISLNDTAVRALAGKTVNGSQISMYDLGGKSGTVTLAYTFSSNTTQTTINVSTITGYRAGKTTLNITINSGVIVYSNSTGTPGLTITGATAGDVVNLINNGYILGCGGAGGNGGQYSAVQTNALTGGAGGPALSIGCTLTITNYGTIGGGGGGGGGGAGGVNTSYPGGGGGGGAGYGVGGAKGGLNGSATAGGAGGQPGTGIGGNGGALGAVGGGGGSYKYAFFTLYVTSYGAGGGGAGAAILRNGNTVYWAATGTINGVDYA